jgi:hypothetical protein
MAHSPPGGRTPRAAEQVSAATRAQRLYRHPGRPRARRSTGPARFSHFGDRDVRRAGQDPDHRRRHRAASVLAAPRLVRRPVRAGPGWIPGAYYGSQERRRGPVKPQWEWQDLIRLLVPPVAFIGWTMLEPVSVWNAVAPHVSSGMRTLIATVGAVVVAAVTKALTTHADKKPPLAAPGPADKKPPQADRDTAATPEKPQPLDVPPPRGEQPPRDGPPGQQDAAPVAELLQQAKLAAAVATDRPGNQPVAAAVRGCRPHPASPCPVLAFPRNPHPPLCPPEDAHGCGAARGGCLSQAWGGACAKVLCANRLVSCHIARGALNAPPVAQ